MAEENRAESSHSLIAGGDSESSIEDVQISSTDDSQQSKYAQDSFLPEIADYNSEGLSSDCPILTNGTDEDEVDNNAHCAVRHLTTTSRHETVFVNKFRRKAAALGISISTVHATGGKTNDNEDAFIMKLITEGTDKKSRPLVGVFGVLDGHGDDGNLISRWAANAMDSALEAIFSRRDLGSECRGLQRQDTMKKIISDVFSAAQDSVKSMLGFNPALAACGATATIVIWDFVEEFMVVGSMGDSPAYVMLRDLKTNERNFKEISTDQGMDSLEERRRTIGHLRNEFGLVPIAKKVVTRQGEAKHCIIYFGPKSDVKSMATRRWHCNKSLKQWIVEGATSVIAPPDWVPCKRPPARFQKENLLPFGRERIFIDVIDGFDVAYVQEHLSPCISYSLTSRNGYDMRLGGCQLATSLGHCSSESDSSDLWRRREPIIDVIDLKGFEVEHILIASDGLTAPLFRLQWQEAQRFVAGHVSAGREAECVPEINTLYNEWAKEKSVGLNIPFEALHGLMCIACDNNMKMHLAHRIERSLERSYLPQVAVDLERYVRKMYGSNQNRIDDITILFVRPKGIFDDFDYDYESRIPGCQMN